MAVAPNTPKQDPPAPGVTDPPAPDSSKTPEQIAAEAAAKKTAETEAAAKKAADDAAAAKEKAPKIPDKYEFKFNGPDGKPVEIEADTAKAFEPVLKELGITQEGLAKLLPLYHAELARQDQLISDLYTAQRDSWAAQAKADKTFGGAGYEENLQMAQQAMARFGSPALKDLLNETGLGNHVEVLRFFEKIGRQISEDKPITPGTVVTGDANAQAAKLFDHPSSKALT